MVLQGLVLSVLKGYLGEFLHDLDNDKLQLELWNGEVELKNCELNPEALDKFDPPVEVVAGSVSTLKLIIPWNALSSESVVIVLEKVRLYVRPLSTSKRRDAIRWAYKRRLLSPSTENTKTTTNNNKEGWFSSLYKKILDNIKLEIRDVRIQYEQEDTSFKLNLQIASLTLRSADSEGRFVFVDSTDSSSSIKKIAKISSLCISHSRKGKAFQDILKPTSISVTLSSSGLSVQVSSVFLGLSRSSQLQDLLYALRQFNSQRRLEEFARMHRPNGRSVNRRSARLWWQYAACCVRPSLTYALTRRRRARLCVSYLKILRASGSDTRRTSARDSLERALDLETLMCLREIASHQGWCEEKKREEDDKKEKEEEEEGWGAYLSSWVTSSIATTTTTTTPKALSKTTTRRWSTRLQSTTYEITLSSFTFNLLNTFEINIKSSLHVVHSLSPSTYMFRFSVDTLSVSFSLCLFFLFSP